MKEDLIFAIATVIIAVIVSALPFIICVLVERVHTNYGVILALFIAPVIRITTNRKKVKND